MKRKAVIYVRVSSKEQEREGFSIDAQKKLLFEYAENNSFEIAKVFAEAETAKQAGRKQFRRMLDYLEEHPEVQDVLVEKVDRMYRNFHDSTAMHVDTSDLRLHFVKQGKVLSKDSKSFEWLHHHIDLAVADYHVKNLAEEVIKGSDEKAAQGGWPGPAPLGYKNKLEDRTIIIHPEESILIKKTFELASTGQHSIRSLKKEIFNMGLRSKRAKSVLSNSAVSRVLKNPFYYGYFWRKGILHKAIHEPIISKQLFDLVQEKMGYVQKPHTTKLSLTYRGTLKCSHCGCTITGEKKKGRYIYYRCTNGKESCTNVTYLREEKIEEALKDALRRIEIPANIIEWTRTALLDASKQEQEYRDTKLASLTRLYKELDNKISLSYDHFLEGRIEEDVWKSKTQQWKSEKVEIQQSLDALELDNDAFMKEGLRLMQLASEAHKLFDYLTPDEKREMVHLVLSNPRIENGTLRYDYKKPFEMFVNVTNLENWRSGRDSNPRPPA